MVKISIAGRKAFADLALFEFISICLHYSNMQVLEIQYAVGHTLQMTGSG